MRNFLSWVYAGVSALMVQAISQLLGDRGTTTARASTVYTLMEVTKAVPNPLYRHGRVVPIYFEMTIVSASNIGDTYQLFTLPKGWVVIGLHAVTDGLAASGGVGCTVAIGDADDPDRLMKATDMDVAEAVGNLAFAGTNYQNTTADAIQLATIGTAAAVVGKIVKGHVLCSPGS